MPFKSYRELRAWQTGIRLVRETYLATQGFPKVEQFGLTAQIRRAAVSIPSNIAEGHARDSTLEFLHFLAISQGSLAELETQLLIATELGFLPEQMLESLLAMANDVGKMIRGLQKTLRARSGKRTSSPESRVSSLEPR